MIYKQKCACYNRDTMDIVSWGIVLPRCKEGKTKWKANINNIITRIKIEKWICMHTHRPQIFILKQMELNRPLSKILER